MDQLTQGTVFESKFVSNFLLRPMIDKHCPQRFVLPLMDLGGFREESPISRIVHDWASIHRDW